MNVDPEGWTAKEALVGIGGAVMTAFGIWRAGSKTKRSVAEDQLGTDTAKSKGDWLKDTEARAEAALAARDAALALHREALAKIASLEARTILQAEGLERRDRRIKRLTRIVVKRAPDLVDALDSLPGALDATPRNIPDLFNDED